jgi:hypothetical protein
VGAELAKTLLESFRHRVMRVARLDFTVVPRADTKLREPKALACRHQTTTTTTINPGKGLYFSRNTAVPAKLREPTLARISAYYPN